MKTAPVMLRFSSIAYRNLRQRPLRTALTMLGVAVAVGGYSAIDGLGRGVEEAWTRSLRAQGTQVLAYRRGSLDLLAGALDANLAGELRQVEGVSVVAPELVDMITLESGETVVVRGWEPGSMLWGAGKIVSGRMPEAEAGAEVVLGESLAGALGLAPGGVLETFGARMRVVGVARLGGVINNHSVIAPLADLQRSLDRPGKVTAFNIRTNRPGDGAVLAEVKARLEQRFPQMTFLDADTAAQSYELYRLWRGLTWATSLVGLAMGLVIVLNTLLVAVLERTREVGVLVAVGWSRRRVLAMILQEGLMITLAGGLVGLAGGMGVLEVLADHPKMRGFIAVTPSLAVLAQHLAVAVALGVAGALYPAWRATRLNPVDVLRDA
jgi:putative ABC transport system permease protein